MQSQPNSSSSTDVSSAPHVEMAQPWYVAVAIQFTQGPAKAEVLTLSPSSNKWRDLGGLIEINSVGSKEFFIVLQNEAGSFSSTYQFADELVLHFHLNGGLVADYGSDQVSISLFFSVAETDAHMALQQMVTPERLQKKQ